MSKGLLLASPRQDRSRDTLDRIVEAARELLAERDFADITVDDIVARARSSKGSFYHRFPDKASLLRYILRLEHERALGRWREFLAPEKWSRTDLAAFIDAFVDRLVSIYRTRTTVMRAYASDVHRGDGETRRLAVELNRFVVEGLRTVVDTKRDQVRHPDPDRACGFLVTALVTLLPPLYLSRSRDLWPAPLRPAELDREVRHLCRVYLVGALD